VNTPRDNNTKPTIMARGSHAILDSFHPVRMAVIFGTLNVK
jgi:hypothetical protein